MVATMQQTVIYVRRPPCCYQAAREPVCSRAMYICEAYTPWVRVCLWNEAGEVVDDESSSMCALRPRKRRMIPNVDLPTLHDVMDDLLGRCHGKKVFLEYDEGEYIRMEGDEELYLAIELSVLYYVKHFTGGAFDHRDDQGDSAAAPDSGGDNSGEDADG